MEENILKKVAFFVSFIGIVLIFVFCLIFDDLSREEQISSLVKGIVKTEEGNVEKFYGVVKDFGGNNKTLFLTVSRVVDEDILFYSSNGNINISGLQINDYVYIEATPDETIMFGEELYVVE